MQMSAELCHKLGYQFKQPKFLKLALTHRSSDDANNERLEFLGDSIVNCVIAEALYLQFPNLQEGYLSRFRATNINRYTLGDLAKQFDLGRYLYLGLGELKSGGSNRPSILSCAMEAIIGAIYLDSHFEAVKSCILRWYQPWLQSLTKASSHKDPKTQLQEYLQSLQMALPVYIVESISGESHQQVFIVSCTVSGFTEKVVGSGSSRRRAEQEAAELMLGKIKK
jgi:ribonuclease III